MLVMGQAEAHCYNAKRSAMDLQKGLLRKGWDQQFVCSIKKVKAIFGTMSRKQQKEAQAACDLQQQDESKVEETEDSDGVNEVAKEEEERIAMEQTIELKENELFELMAEGEMVGDELQEDEGNNN